MGTFDYCNWRTALIILAAFGMVVQTMVVRVCGFIFETNLIKCVLQMLLHELAFARRYLSLPKWVTSNTNLFVQVTVTAIVVTVKETEKET